ncbi:MAG: tRNA glutamyl-Q(34) synthetase GluQRS [Betaproteobacteria bacterium]
MTAATLYRGRFAPSPTGPLHFGSLVAAMASYADARAAGGLWHVRIEDVDTPRARPGADSLILAALERLGFEWDGPVWRQSSRREAYDEALAALRTAGLVYPCTCTRRALAQHPLGRLGERVYPGTCRADAADAQGTPAAYRVRVPATAIAFDDRLYGHQAQDLARDVGDFVVLRSDGLFSYQLAVVVDDGEQRISDVVRGADLLTSTPRQIFLQEALGLATPRYLHVPVAVDAQGVKLSKQHGAQPLPASPLPALLAAWSFLDQEPPHETPASTRAFWTWACANWRPRRLHGVPTRLAPAPYDR